MAEEHLYYVDQLVEQAAFPIKGTLKTQFDDCTFRNCDFTTVDFTGVDFVNCSFAHCNLSMAKFNQVGFDQVRFADCKMIGADFSYAKDFLFSVSFSDCILDYVAFIQKKNRKALFSNCSLKSADFSEADLTSSTFERSDLTDAVFMHSTLNEVDFTSAYNFIIDPEKNSLKKARFSPYGLVGLLTNYEVIVEEH